MRKAWLAGALAVLMMTSAALAEVYEGTAVATASYAVTAPAGGTLRELQVAAGDVVEAGDTLASIGTKRVFATQDGTIARIGVQQGETAEGTVLELYPVERYQVYCTVEKAYPSAESTLVHSGETVYMKCTADGTHRGIGQITQIDGGEYRVLAIGGEFYVGETVYLYRNADFSTGQRVGIGTVVTSDTETYEAEGRIVRMCVSEGEYVERGELLYEFSDGEGTEVAAEVAGIVAEVAAQQGDALEEDQALLTIVPPEQICVEVSVDETAAARLAVGDPVELVYASDAEETPVQGRVASISHIAEDGAYSVRIAPEETSNLKLDLAVSVRFCEE